jgi:uncharacterized protein YggE
MEVLFMRFLIPLFLLCASLSPAQILSDSHNLNVNGEAEVKVAPDRVRLSLGVETRNKDLSAAVAQNDAAVRRVIEAVRAMDIAAADIQTDYFHIDLSYNDHDRTLVDYYHVTKGVEVLLRDVAKFESLMKAALMAGANHLYDVEFSTSELRKYRDQARALAMKAAREKANDLAAAAGLKVREKPLAVSAYNYGGGSWYSSCCGPRYGGNAYQNVVQNVGGDGGIAAGGTFALGKISVTASVSATFQLE